MDRWTDGLIDEWIFNLLKIPFLFFCRLLDAVSFQGKYKTELIVYLVFEYIDQDLDSCIRHSLPRGLDVQTIKVSNQRGKGREGERNVPVITSIIIKTVVI